MNENEVVNQHYISRKLINLFSIPNSEQQIYQLDTYAEKEYEKLKKKSTKKVLCDEYAYETNNLAKNTLELIFAENEATLIPKIKEIVVLLEKKESINIIHKKVLELLIVFLSFYLKSGGNIADWGFSVDKGNKKEYTISRLISSLLKENYLRGLFSTIYNNYNFAIIQDNTESLVLCDHYIATASTDFKIAMSSPISIGNIGLKNIIILIPLSSKYYIVFTDDANIGIKFETINIISTEVRDNINRVIRSNAYRYIVGGNENILQELIKVPVLTNTPMIMLFSGRNSKSGIRVVKKPDVFYNIEDLIKYFKMQQGANLPIWVRELKNEGKLDIGRNDLCFCNSGKKYKKCCLFKIEDYYLKKIKSDEYVREQKIPTYYKNCVIEDIISVNAKYTEIIDFQFAMGGGMDSDIKVYDDV